MFRAQARRNEETHDCSTLLMAHAHGQLSTAQLLRTCTIADCSTNAQLRTAEQMHCCPRSTAQHMHNRPLLNTCTVAHCSTHAQLRTARPMRTAQHMRSCPLLNCSTHAQSSTAQPMHKHVQTAQNKHSVGPHHRMQKTHSFTNSTAHV